MMMHGGLVFGCPINGKLEPCTDALPNSSPALLVRRFTNEEISTLKLSSSISDNAAAGVNQRDCRRWDLGQVLSCRLTSSGKTFTSQGTVIPSSSRRLSYVKNPIGFALMVPRTPASSYASRAADFTAFSPLIGQPLGIIHRFDFRVVTSRISISPFFVK